MGLGLVVLLMLELVVFIVGNIVFLYFYFNLVFGGVKVVYGEYEFDYWGVSVKKVVDWMIDE